MSQIWKNCPIFGGDVSNSFLLIVGKYVTIVRVNSMPILLRIFTFLPIKFSSKSLFLLLLILFWIGHSNTISSQESHEFNISYISPRPFAKYVNPHSCIAFRPDKITNQGWVLEKTHIKVKGSQSGDIDGSLYFANDQLTCFFLPVQPFVPGEQVLVNIYSDDSLTVFEFEFSVSSTSKTFQIQVLNEVFESELPIVSDHLKNQPIKDLPFGLPDITITHENDPAPGYFFLGTISNKSRSNEFIAIYDNYAQPVFYRELLGNTPSDFKLQMNGNLSYHGRTNWEFYELNPFFEIIDTIRAGNGMLADNHELLILENNHKYLLVHDPQLIDMSLIVPGGNPMATVIGLIVQELDENNNVVFQWRSWDHFEITDAADRINLTGSIIDYVHGNSVELDTDSTMIISCRNMDEVTRINRITGEIIWRLGGKRNQFEFDDSLQMFCHQHDARIVFGNGNLSVFDNGNCHDPQYSSAAEYLLDTDAMTATLVNRLRSTPDIFGSFMGNAQRLENGRTVVGWGSGIPSITEFDESGEIALQFSFNNINYRAFKFDWQSPVFTANVDTLVFDTIPPNDSLTTQLSLVNHFHREMVINEVFFQASGFQLLDELPVQIAAGEEFLFTIQFKPTEEGEYRNVVTLCEDINTDELKQRVSHQVFLNGYSEMPSNVLDLDGTSSLKVFPNPFVNEINLQSDQSNIQEMIIYNGMGIRVFQKQVNATSKLSFVTDLPDGFYFILIKTEDNQVYRTHLIRTSDTY